MEDSVTNYPTHDAAPVPRQFDYATVVTQEDVTFAATH